MIRPNFARFASAALAVMVLTGQVRADVKDYEFRIVETELKQGAAVLTARLTDKRTGEAVPDAVVFATRIDMAPDGMESMTSKIEEVPSTELGLYRFAVDLTMAGNWRLSLGAKVQGETGTLENRLPFRVVE